MTQKCQQQKIKIIEIQYFIWNNHGNSIQIFTNMPGIGSLIREIDVNINKMKKVKILLLSKTNARVLSINSPRAHLVAYLSKIRRHF